MIRPLLIESRKRVLRAYRRWRRPRVIRHAGVLVALDDRIHPAILEYLYSGEYERSEVKTLRRLLRPDDVVMELGAGIGFVSLVCARLIGAERVFAFEANPALEPLIRGNYDLNRLHPNLSMCILGEEAGEADFYVHDLYWSSSTRPGAPGTHRVRIPSRSLNDEIRRIDPTFLVLDIEGGEEELIRIVDFHNIRKIAMELHTESIGREAAEGILRRLREAGFTWEPRPLDGPVQQFYAVRS